MAQGSRSWIAIFGVATVFYIYSVFVSDRVLRKRGKVSGTNDRRLVIIPTYNEIEKHQSYHRGL